MATCLARLWLGFLVLAATFSKSSQEAFCFSVGNLLFCVGNSNEDVVDLNDPTPNVNKNVVERIQITGSRVENFSREVLLSFPMLREMALSDNEISSEFFPVGVFKDVQIERLSITQNNIEYNNHFAKVINDLESLYSLNLDGNPIRNFDPAAIEIFDRINMTSFSTENIVCDCDLSWFRNYLLNYEGGDSTFPVIKCESFGMAVDITESNFCSASDQMMLECRVCNRASSNEECNAMGTETCSTTQLSTNPLCRNDISFVGGEKRITKGCAGPSLCNSANNERTCYTDNPTRCSYCCRGELCNDFETGVLENYYPPNYPFRPTTPVPTTTIPTTTEKLTTSLFTTASFTTSPVPTTQSQSTLATTNPTTTERTTILTTSETAKTTTTFLPTTETTTLPTTTILTTMPKSTTKFTTMEPTSTTITMQPTTTKITTMQPTTTLTTMRSTTTIVTTLQPTTTTVTTLQPTTTVTTMEPTTTMSPTTIVTTKQPTTTPTTMEPSTMKFTTAQATTTTLTTMKSTTLTTMQPTTTTLTTMQPTTTTPTTMQPTTTTVTTMQPTTTTVTTMQPTTTTVTTMQPTTTTVTTMQPTTTTVTTMQPTTTTVTTMQPTTTTLTTLQPTTTIATTVQPTTTTATTVQPTTTTTATTMQPTTTVTTVVQPTTKTATTMSPTSTNVVTTKPLTTTASTTKQDTTVVTTKLSKPTTIKSTQETTPSSTPQITTIATAEQGSYTTPELTTSPLDIVETTTTVRTNTVSPTTMVYDCPAVNQTGRYGDLSWPETKADSDAIIDCPFNFENSTAKAIRMCVLRDQFAQWMEPNLSSCASNSDVLERLARENVTTENIVKIADELAEVTDESDTLEESDVENAVTVIESVSKVVNEAKNETEHVLNDIIETVNHLSQVEDEQLAEAQRTGNTSSRIIRVVESTIMSIEIQGNEYNRSSEALDVKIIILNNETEAGNIRFPGSDVEDDEEENEERDDKAESSSQTFIEIPKSVVSDSTRIQFILYKDTSLFQAIITAGETTTPRSECADEEGCVIERQALRSYVISASIENRTVKNLDTPIVNTFTHLTDDDEEYANNSQCVFWDFTAAGGRGDWSTEGCSVNSSESGVTICHCTHLTNFALLLDIYGNVDEISENHQRILTYISLGGVGLSFFCLVLSLVSYSCAGRLRSDKRVKVLLNLMVALMIMNMAFLFDSMVSAFAFDSKYLCFGAAILMHYSLLCVMTWMAVEAFTMYLALVRVFDSKQRHFILKVFFLGWGLPAVIIGASVGVDRESYGYFNNLCYLNRIPFFITFFVPACIVLIWNSTVYVLVSRQMCRLRKRQTKFSQTFSLSDQLRASFSLTFLLGLTWIFGFFSFGNLNLAFTYIFAITNALQGFIVFVFHCVLKKEIRRQWHALCCPCFPMLKDGEDGTGTYSRSRSGTNGSNGIRHNTLLSNRRDYDPVNLPSGRSTRSRSWFWQPDHRRRSVAESTTTDMTRLSAVPSEIGSTIRMDDVRSSRGGRNSHITTFDM